MVGGGTVLVVSRGIPDRDYAMKCATSGRLSVFLFPHTAGVRAQAISPLNTSVDFD